MSLLDFLTGKAPRPEADDSDIETVRSIARELGEMDPARARHVACFAYVLGRVAHADFDISDVELAAMEKIVADRAGVPQRQAVLITTIAKQRNELFGGTDNFLVTREFTKLTSEDERKALLDCLFAVSACDGMISAVEDAEMRQVATELKLSHRDFIETRLRYTEFLSVLKD